MMAISLYSLFSIHFSPSLVLFLGNFLDAYPIKALLEAMRGAISWDDIVQVLFLYKCGQFIWCNAFNVVVTIYFPDISSFVVGTALLLPLNLIFPKWLTP